MNDKKKRRLADDIRTNLHRASHAIGSLYLDHGGAKEADNLLDLFTDAVRIEKLADQHFDAASRVPNAADLIEAAFLGRDGDKRLKACLLMSELLNQQLRKAAIARGLNLMPFP